MIWDSLKGRGLFVFSDPAGAKAMLALVHYLKEKEQLSACLVVSDRKFDFYSDFNVEVVTDTGAESETISGFRPDFIFTGTSYTSRLELRYIQDGNVQGIPTFAFIDHWTNFSLRFEYNGAMVWPGTIVVIDETAYNKACEEGLPKEKLVTADNPYYRYLQNWTPQLSKEAFYTQIGITANSKVVAFVPEPLSQVNGKERFGFTELELLEKILEELPRSFWHNTNNYFIVKLHPNQHVEPMKRIVDKHADKNIQLVAGNMNVNTLLTYSDMVIGIFSNILVEGKLLGANVYQYLPAGYKGENLIADFKLPVVNNLSTIDF